jgi:hypothetical protein
MALVSRARGRRAIRRGAVCTLGAALCFSAVSLSLPARADHHETKQAEELSTAKRIEIFQALNAARSRADSDAEKRSAADPESLKQAELADELSRKYKAEVREKYGITSLQGEEIVAEGYEKSWRTGTAAAGPVKTSLD